MDLVNLNNVTPLGWRNNLCTILCAGGNITCIGACAVDGPLPFLDAKGAVLSLAIGTGSAVAVKAALGA